MPTLHLSFLGGFQVARAGLPVTRFGGEKVRALLAYLAVESDRPHARTTLAALLWPDLPDELALRNLSQSLVRLREALGEPTDDALLQITRQTIAWRAAAAVDVAAFLRLASSGALVDLEQAAALYQGELLAGFSLASCDAFAEWLLLSRNRLQAQALAALGRLGELLLGAARHVEAAAVARQQLGLDPWRETAYRQLMRALAAADDRAGALAAYERCRQSLLADLSMEPDAATTALAAQIRHAQPAAPAKTVQTELINTLPSPRTALVGREEELATLDGLLRGGARMVTLLGPGGVGKTRLALAAAHMLRAAFPDGVCWVSLAGIRDWGDALVQTDALANTILAALRVAPGGQRAPRDELRAVLHKQALLLIFDNCEHLPSVGQLVAELLAAAPGLRVLATSRERLGGYGEEPLLLEGLPLPGEATSDVAQAAAVQLFLVRARRQVRGFGGDATTLAGVVRLCRLLEGMPLGIELAAHWVGDYSPDEIAAAVRADLAFLAARDLQTADRHRSLRAVFDHSWRLLPEPEQRALARLSVFVGGFDRTAALEIAAARPATLATLVDKSLLRRVSAGRYSMHELLRQFAAEQLDGMGDEGPAVQSRHSTWYLAFVAVREQRMMRAAPRDAAAEIHAQIDNVRQAWAWAVAHAQIDDLEAAANGLYHFYAVTGQAADREQALELACQRVRVCAESALDDASVWRTLTRLLALYALALVVRGKYEQALLSAQQAIALGHWSAEGEMVAYLAWGRTLYHQGDFPEARVQLERTLSLISTHRRSHAVSDLIEVVEWAAYNWLGNINLGLGDYDRARSSALQALQLCQAQGRRLGEVDCLCNLANIERTMHNLPMARQHCEQALRLAPTLSSRTAEGRIQFELGQVLRLQGEYPLAYELTERALAVFQAIAETTMVQLATAALAEIASAMGDDAHAELWSARLAALSDSASTPELQLS